MSTQSLAVAYFCALVASSAGELSCAPRTALKSYAVSVLIERETGIPAPGVALEMNGKVVARSDETGKAQLELRGTEGASVALDVRCPINFQPAEPLTARLLTLATGPAPTLHALCSPTTRHLAVVIRAARGELLPVVHHAKTLATTDADGIAHVLLEGRPGDTFAVALDTSSRPELRPQNPQALFTVSGEDAVAPYDLEFTVPARPPARYVIVKAAAKGPVRIR